MRAILAPAKLLLYNIFEQIEEVSMPFKVFDRKGAPATTKAWITIQRRGNFGINRAAFQEMGEPEAVELLWDAENRRIGFKKTDPQGINAYPVRKQQNSVSYLVAGQAFTKYCGIDTEEARRYQITNEDGLAIIALNSDSTEVSRATETDR